ncbi:hypothetical protein ACQPZK_07585 [Micromonospora sp. CA-249363]|uniref:hypothetical protein n=1 Tax=Micromonospora sp. CA-249363 TaxID=3239963 RepID=UPI003D908226
MIVTYTPEGEEAQTWEFSPGRIRSSEAEILQKRFGGPWDQFAIGVQSGDVRARRVMLWHCLRRDHHTLRFEDMPEFMMDELKVEFTKEEFGRMLVDADKTGKLTAEERETIEMAMALAPEGLGKAGSKS